MPVVSTDVYRKEVAQNSLTVFHANYSKYSDIVFDLFHSEIYHRLGNSMWDSDHEREVVYADATNLTARAREKLRNIAELLEAETHLIFFANLNDALERNKLRDEDQIVPDDVMENMVRQYEETLTVIHSEPYTTRTMIQNYSKEPNDLEGR